MKSNIPYQAPTYGETSFNCPHCHAFSSIIWSPVRDNQGARVDKLDVAYCRHCKMNSVWYEEVIIYPRSVVVDEPNGDLPDEVRECYLEAASILQESPRGSAALLRLAIQKLCDYLVGSSADLNSKISILVTRGLDTRIQKSLDIVRVIGNEAVHPGQINFKDDPTVAHQLFKLVSIIAQRMITEPKEIDLIYESLPEEKRRGIEARDKKGAGEK